MKRLIQFFLLALIIVGCQKRLPDPHSIPKNPANANPIQVSLNGIGLPEKPERAYQILVVGHMYGSFEGEDQMPAKALLNKVPQLNAGNLSMLISLGDMVKTTTLEDFEELDEELLSELSFPVFNTPGNHDVEDRALYEKLFGQTFFSFKYGSARMVFLDTERQECAIDAEQLDMLRSVLNHASSDPGTDLILIFMHKTLFFNNDKLLELQKDFALPNQWKCFTSPYFPEVLHSILIPQSVNKPIYLFAGDVGATGNLTPYYETLADGRITLIMTGLGDTPKDSGILITVSDNEIYLENYSLTDADLPLLETFTPEYWIKRAEGN